MLLDRALQTLAFPISVSVVMLCVGKQVPPDGKRRIDLVSNSAKAETEIEDTRVIWLRPKPKLFWRAIIVNSLKCLLGAILVNSRKVSFVYKHLGQTLEKV